MADLTQTAANVQSGAGNTTQTRDASVAVTAGDSVYLDANNLVTPCENDQTATEALCAGVALNDAAAGQPVTYQTGGQINLGATLVVGETYVVGAVAGAIAPVADVIATEFSTIIGVAISTSLLEMGLLPSGVAHG